MSLPRRLLLALGPLSALLLPACGGDPTAPPSGMPAPTQHRLDEEAESRNREARERWFEEMHRAAPDVDWRAVERDNALREMARRRSLPPASWRSSWTEVGSSNQAGRMMCAVLGPDGVSGRKLYAGSALGGLWRADPDGTNWEPLGDNLYGGVQELVVLPGPSPTSPEVVLVWTGGTSLFLTADDGATWAQPTGLSGLVEVRSLAQQRVAGTDTILLLARASLAAGTRQALFVSADRGASFQLRHEFAGDWPGSLWLPREATKSTPLYVVQDGACQVSTDQGRSFQTLATLDASATRAVLAGSAAGAPDLYATVLVGGNWRLYHSADGGSTFVLRTTLTDYWEALAVSPTDPSRVLAGGVEAWRSLDHGRTFTQVNRWWDYYGNPADMLHADMMGFHVQLDPTDPSKELWYLSTDGGVYESRDRMATVQNLALSGLGVSQYYSTLTSRRVPDLIQAGSQDQGYQRGVLQAPGGSGPSTPFNQLISGDYGHLTSQDGTHDVVFSTYPGFVLIADGEASPALYTASFPTGTRNLWLPPVVAHPLDKNSFFFCGSELWLGVRTGNQWNYQLHSNEDFSQGGGNYLTALAFAPGNSNQAYAVTDAGLLFESTDRGVTWSQGSGPAPGEHYFYGNALAVHPADDQRAMVGGSGYSAIGVRMTVDGGATWQAMDAGLPSTLVYDLAWSWDGTYVYAATQSGPYRWSPLTRQWSSLLEQGTPITLYWSVEAIPGSRDIRFGTYGRGIWDYEEQDPVPTLFLSLRQDAVLQGLAVDDGDVFAYDVGNRKVSAWFDVSDVISTNVDVDALCVLADGSLLLSFAQDEQVDNLQGGPDGLRVADEDLVQFIPSSLGANTSGTFQFYFDGSDVGFGGARDDVDAVSQDDAGNLLLSLRAPWDLGGGFSGKDEDILTFAPTSLGANTAGSLGWFLDGSTPAIRLATKGEDVDSLAVLGTDRHFTVSTAGAFRVPKNLQGGSGDLIRFQWDQVGRNPAGTWAILWRSASLGAALNVDALHVDE